MLETLRFDRKLEITFEVDDPSSKPRRWEDKLYIVLGEGGGMDGYENGSDVARIRQVIPMFTEPTG